MWRAPSRRNFGSKVLHPLLFSRLAVATGDVVVLRYMHGYRLQRALDPCELDRSGRRRERKLQRAAGPDAAVPAVVLFLVLDLPADDSELELKHPGEALPHELSHSVTTERHRRGTPVRRGRRHAVQTFPPRLEKPPLRALQLGTGARERLAVEPELDVERRGFPDAGREVAMVSETSYASAVPLGSASARRARYASSTVTRAGKTTAKATTSTATSVATATAKSAVMRRQQQDLVERLQEQAPHTQQLVCWQQASKQAPQQSVSTQRLHMQQQQSQSQSPQSMTAAV